jgi:hypothetical protein
LWSGNITANPNLDNAGDTLSECEIFWVHVAAEEELAVEGFEVLGRGLEAAAENLLVGWAGPDVFRPLSEDVNGDDLSGGFGGLGECGVVG